MPDIIVPSEPPVKLEVRVVRKMQDYVVNNLGKLTELTAVDPERARLAGEPPIMFQGFAVLGVQAQGKIVELPVEFSIDATSIDEAFDKFKESAQIQLHKNMEAARKQAVQAQLQESAQIGKQIAGGGMKLVT